MHDQDMMGTFLGFDFGTKRIGIAVGQSITQTARPLITLSAQNGVPQPLALAKVIQEWQPTALIVGLAMQPDGSHSATSRKALKFGQSLHAQFQLPVYYIEERLTSVAALERIKESSTTSAIERDKDAQAAAIILESWLQSELKEKHAPV
ncbi:MAG: Holliday junction resolvase RuvX [Proteobacteria bacterium]|nr:Holliday junction resolvase RuvX [Pseudomonadota bacterium]